MHKIRYKELYENSKERICGNCKYFNPYYVKSRGKEYMIHLGQCEYGYDYEKFKACVPGNFIPCRSWTKKETKEKD